MMRLLVTASVLAALSAAMPVSAQANLHGVVAAPATAESALARLDADQRAIAWDGSAWPHVSSLHLKQRIYDDGNRGLRLDTVRFHTARDQDLPLLPAQSGLAALAATASAWQDIGQTDKVIATISASRSRRSWALSPFPKTGVTSDTRMVQLGWQHGDVSTMSIGWFGTGADLTNTQDDVARILAGEPLAAKGFRLALDMSLDGTPEKAKTRFSLDVRRESLEAMEPYRRGQTTRFGFSLTRNF